jgi:hypothetical protein
LPQAEESPLGWKSFAARRNAAFALEARTFLPYTLSAKGHSAEGAGVVRVARFEIDPFHLTGTHRVFVHRINGSQNGRNMFGSKKHKNKDQERFYLLPGMGGRAYRRKQNRILIASIAVGLIVAGVFALVVWFTQHSPK